MPSIFSLLSGGLLGQIGDLAKVFFGSTAERDTAIAEEMKAIQEAYKAELLAPEKTNWWNIFIEGLNRLVRPFFTFGTVALFTWAVVDPVQFVASMSALAAVPDMMWYLIYTIVGFWFGGRLLQNAPTTYKTINPKILATILATKKQVEKLGEMSSENDVGSSPTDISGTTVNVVDVSTMEPSAESTTTTTKPSASKKMTFQEIQKRHRDSH